jgi:hypothetical protein
MSVRTYHWAELVGTYVSRSNHPARFANLGLGTDRATLENALTKVTGILLSSSLQTETKSSKLSRQWTIC